MGGCGGFKGSWPIVTTMRRSGPMQLFTSDTTSQTLLDQSHAGPYISERATIPPPLFEPSRVPYPKAGHFVVDKIFFVRPSVSIILQLPSVTL